MSKVNPIIRPRRVFIVFDEYIPRPDHSVAAVTRSPGCTVIYVQPHAAHHRVAADVNALLRDADEYLGWITPYLGDDQPRILRFRASPTPDNLTPRILRTPILPSYIPTVLRAPGVIYK